MPKNRVFRQADIEAILEVIRAWPKDKISWEEVLDKATPILGFTPSRQGMNQRKVILEAFQSKKKYLHATPKPHSPLPSSLAMAAKRIDILNAEVAELTAMNIRLKDRLQKWYYNAHLKGVSGAMLDKPLPLIDREVDKAEENKTGRSR